MKNIFYSRFERREQRAKREAPKSNGEMLGVGRKRHLQRQDSAAEERDNALEVQDDDEDYVRIPSREARRRRRNACRLTLRGVRSRT